MFLQNSTTPSRRSRRTPRTGPAAAPWRRRDGAASAAARDLATQTKLRRARRRPFATSATRLGSPCRSGCGPCGAAVSASSSANVAGGCGPCGAAVSASSSSSARACKREALPRHEYFGQIRLACLRHVRYDTIRLREPGEILAVSSYDLPHKAFRHGDLARDAALTPAALRRRR